MEGEMNNYGNPAKSKEDLLAGLQEAYQRFVKSLKVDRLDVGSVSVKAKTPFKAFVLRESLFYRMTDLSGAAIDLYKQNKIVPAIIIIRAVYETAALCFYVYKNLNHAIEEHDVVKIDDFLMNASLGGKIDEVRYKAFNILTIIGHLDKQFPGLLDMYACLCEFAHPNWMGCEGSYATLNPEEHYYKFSMKKENIKQETIGLSELSIALVVFEHYYNKMADILLKLVTVCEEYIDKRMAKFRLLAETCLPEHNLSLYIEVEQSRTWAICFEGTDKIVAACAIDESEIPQLTDKHNEHLSMIINDKGELVFITNNKDLRY